MITLDHPRDRDTHTLADFGELVCYFSPDGTCSREAIRDRIEDSSGGADVSEERLADCFEQFEWRARAFGESYPFSLDERKRVLSTRPALIPLEWNYLILLLCSNLAFLDRRTYKAFTETFELISRVALKSIWFPKGEVRPFGKNQTDFVGSKAERLNKLAALIGAKGNAHQRQFRDGDVGDGGIDVAAWLALDQFESRNIPSALAQCACSRADWVRKQAEISVDTLGSKIVPTHRWMQMLFSPVCYRDNAGEWAFGEVAQTLFFDRLRILNSIDGSIISRGIDIPLEIVEILDAKIDRWQ